MIKKSQNFLYLGVIPVAALGIPQMGIGQQLAQRYGAGEALCSIFVGNLLLWLIAVGVIAMMERAHIDAIENIKKYFGGVGGVLAAVVFFVVFVNWYALQINVSMGLLMPGFEWGVVIRVGAALGLLVTLLAVGGLDLLRKLSVVGMPLFVCYQGYAWMVSEREVVFEWGLAFPAVLASMFLTFPVIIMFPTLFRYSKSNAHSYLALALITLVVTFFQVSTIWVDFASGSGVVLVVFVIWKLLCCNLFNVYLASACWEAIVPRFTAAKEYAIIGLIGTLVYTLVQVSEPVQFLQAVTDGYLASLGIVLLIAYLMRVMIQHRPRPLEKSISVASWVFGCLVVTLHEAHYFPQSTSGLVVAMGSSLLFFVCVLFVEETVWSVRAKMRKV